MLLNKMLLNERYGMDDLRYIDIVGVHDVEIPFPYSSSSSMSRRKLCVDIHHNKVAGSLLLHPSKPR